VEGHNYLGIYISRDRATVVCLGAQGRDRNVLGCFTVSVESRQEQDDRADMSQLARLIAGTCAEKIPKYGDCEVAVALDCTMFMQHAVHTEFKDAKQIAATVRFDTEEALSTDITDSAIAFKIVSSDQTGSELTVFTAQRKILSDIILALQSNNIDPVNIEPDINSLSRFILQNVSLPEDSNSLFAVLARQSGYFLAFAKTREILAVRTFLLDPRQDRTSVLARQAPLTIALLGTTEPINYLKVFDSDESVNCQHISEKLAIQVDSVDLIENPAIEPAALADCAGPVDFAIASGAALAYLDKDQSVNFRNDFMPYQGKKQRLQKTLKFLSVSVSILMLALGMYVTSQLWRINKDRSRMRSNIKPDYLAVMLGETELPATSGEILRKLGSELRRTKELRGAGTPRGEESVSTKLTLVLEAFNKCAAKTKLRINKVSVTAKTIRVEGSTSGRSNTRKLFNAIKSKLLMLQYREDEKAGRDTFTLTAALKK